MSCFNKRYIRIGSDSDEHSYYLRGIGKGDTKDKITVIHSECKNCFSFVEIIIGLPPNRRMKLFEDSTAVKECYQNYVKCPQDPALMLTATHTFSYSPLANLALAKVNSKDMSSMLHPPLPYSTTKTSVLERFLTFVKEKLK